MKTAKERTYIRDDHWYSLIFFTLSSNGFLESWNMAVLWGQAIIHGKQSNWSGGKKEPESVHQVQLEWSNITKPEENNDKQNCGKVYQEEQSKEWKLA